MRESRDLPAPQKGGDLRKHRTRGPLGASETAAPDPAVREKTGEVGWGLPGHGSGGAGVQSCLRSSNDGSCQSQPSALTALRLQWHHAN